MPKGSYDDTGFERAHPNLPRDEGESFGSKLALGYVAAANASSNRRAAMERIRELTGSARTYAARCADGRANIEAFEERRATVGRNAYGWPLEIVAVLAAATVILEYVPAALFTQIFVSASDTLRQLLTITFTVIGALSSIFLGELLHRMRVTDRRTAIDTLVVIAAVTLLAFFLLIGYELRLTYTRAVGAALASLSPTVEAIALTSVAAVGIMLTVASTYYRESFELFNLRHILRRLNRQLIADAYEMQAAKTDLERALSAVRSSVPDEEPSSPGWHGEAQERPSGSGTARLENGP